MTGLLALLFRHPNAPRWTRPEIVAMVVCVPVTATTGLGLGYIAYGLSQLVRGTGDPRELLVLAGVVIVVVLAWRALRIGRRLQSYARAAGPTEYPATEPTLVTDEAPPRGPRRSSRRAA